MNRRNLQSTIGTTVALFGFLMVVFAFDFTIPGLEGLAWSSLHIQRFIGLTLLAVGTVIIAKR